jgi:hypothetical protein
MSYAALLLRLALAFVAGWIVYMIAAVLDVLAPVGGAEAFIGLFVQPAMGAVFTGVAIGVLGFGLPHASRCMNRVTCCMKRVICFVNRLICFMNQVIHPTGGSRNS